MNTKTLAQLAVCLATTLYAQAYLSAQPADQSQSSGQSAGQTMSSSTNGVRISKLKGADVKSKNGEELGKLEDLILDPKTGQITFAIVGKGTPLGLGDRPHPVPWQDVMVNSERQVTLNVDKQKLQSGPTVSSDYSELNNPNAVVVIYHFYAVPVPAMGGPGETPGGTQGGAQGGAQGGTQGGGSGSSQGGGSGGSQTQPGTTPPSSSGGSNP